MVPRTKIPPRSFALGRPAKVIRAVTSGHVDIVGHPTGRLLLTRDAYPLDLFALIDAAAEIALYGAGGDADDARVAGSELLRRLRGEPEHGGENFCMLMGQLFSESSKWKQLIFAEFGPAMHRFRMALALAQTANDDLPAARANYERALKIFENNLGENHPNVATLVNNLGGVLQDLGDLPAARDHFERALKIDEAAEILGVSEATAKRWWAYSRAWLFNEISAL